MGWQNILKEDVNELEKIVEELEKAVKLHTSQAERIRAYLKKLKE